MESDVSGRKVRISAILDGYLPGVRRAFSESWSSSFRAFLRERINPFSVAREGEEALHDYLSKASSRSRVQTHQVFLACQGVARICQMSMAAGTLNEDFFCDLQDEIARELRLLEISEAESESLACRIAEIDRKLHPSDNPSTIPGVGPHTAPIFLSSIGNPVRFRNQFSFANWEGVVPGARQSSNVEAKGLRMTKAGPSILRVALYQAGEIGRRNDPGLAAVYHREMVYHGKNHRQAMGAVMSHLGARVWRVLKEDRPYEIRDLEGKSVDKNEARKLILSQYHVSEEGRRERRRRNIKANTKGEAVTVSVHEAVDAPQAE